MVAGTRATRTARSHARDGLQTRWRELALAELARRRRDEAKAEAAPPWRNVEEAVALVRGAPDEIDWAAPDYVSVEEARRQRLERLRSHPALAAIMRAHYATAPVEFIRDWGYTFDPRNPEVGLPAMVPFIPFPRQVEWLEYALERWGARRRGITEKSRDSGLSWLAVALSTTLCLLREGLVIGFGSRLEEYVDKLGEPKSLFEKARIFLRALPEELCGGWRENKHSFHMRLIFPVTGSLMTGEGGDNIGRGNRTSLYFVDEAAHLSRPMLAEASLSNTTHARHDISTPAGLGNPFEQNARSGRFEVFRFHWRSDPRKNDDWYQKQVAEATSPAIVAQEIDIDYAASVEGVLIPASWVSAAIDAHVKLQIGLSGKYRCALDVADEGSDKNAIAAVHGVVIVGLDEWSGEDSDIYRTVQRAFDACQEFGANDLRYDADGLGAGVRGDARVINEARFAARGRWLAVEAFRGSGEPMRPAAQDVKGRTNRDFFANRKAQAWWSLRCRFQATHRWVVEGIVCDRDEIVSISSEIAAALRSKLMSELSQPTYSLNGAGKILIDKAPAGTRSPNLADAVMMALAPDGPHGLILSPKQIAAVRSMPKRNLFAPAAAR